MAAGERVRDEHRSQDMQPLFENAPVEVFEIAADLHIDLCREPEMLWIVEEMYNVTLPPGWQKHRDKNMRVFYHNSETGLSQWNNPFEHIFVDMPDYQRQATRDNNFEGVEDALRSLDKRRMAEAEQWQRLFDEEGVGFFYHPARNEVARQDPKATLTQETRLRFLLIDKMKRRFPLIACHPTFSSERSELRSKRVTEQCKTGDAVGQAGSLDTDVERQDSATAQRRLQELRIATEPNLLLGDRIEHVQQCGQESDLELAIQCRLAEVVARLRRQERSIAAMVEVQRHARVFLARRRLCLLWLRQHLVSCQICLPIGSDEMWRWRLWMAPLGSQAWSALFEDTGPVQIVAEKQAEFAGPTIDLFASASSYGAGSSRLADAVVRLLLRVLAEGLTHWRTGCCAVAAEERTQEVAHEAECRRLEQDCRRAEAAAIRLQALVRGHIARQQIKLLHPELRHRLDAPATAIQSCWRRYLAQGLAAQLVEETCWPLKAWFDYSSTASAAAVVEVHILPNPSFNATRHIASEYEDDTLYSSGASRTPIGRGVGSMAIERKGPSVSARQEPSNALERNGQATRERYVVEAATVIAEARRKTPHMPPELRAGHFFEIMKVTRRQGRRGSSFDERPVQAGGGGAAQRVPRLRVAPRPGGARLGGARRAPRPESAPQPRAGRLYNAIAPDGRRSRVPCSEEAAPLSGSACAGFFRNTGVAVAAVAPEGTLRVPLVERRRPERGGGSAGSSRSSSASRIAGGSGAGGAVALPRPACASTLCLGRAEQTAVAVRGVDFRWIGNDQQQQ